MSMAFEVPKSETFALSLSSKSIFADLKYPADAYAAVLEHSGIQSDAWRASVPLICFDIVEVHLPKRVLRQ